MSEWQAMDLAWAVLALVLVGSAFLSMRLPWGQAARMAAAWVAIFAVALVVISQRDGFARLYADTRRDLLGEGQMVSGTTVRIPVSGDGHFYAEVEINGRHAVLLVDSGATYTGLSRDAARALGVTVDESADPVIIATANGEVAAYRARIGELVLGSITARDLPVVVSAAFGETNVLGMNFLSQLDGWRVEGRTLILQPRTNVKLT